MIAAHPLRISAILENIDFLEARTLCEGEKGAETIQFLWPYEKPPIMKKFFHSLVQPRISDTSSSQNNSAQLQTTNLPIRGDSATDETVVDDHFIKDGTIPWPFGRAGHCVASDDGKSIAFMFGGYASGE